MPHIKVVFLWPYARVGGACILHMHVHMHMHTIRAYAYRQHRWANFIPTTKPAIRRERLVKNNVVEVTFSWQASADRRTILSRSWVLRNLINAYSRRRFTSRAHAFQARLPPLIKVCSIDDDFCLYFFTPSEHSSARNPKRVETWWGRVHSTV